MDYVLTIIILIVSVILYFMSVLERDMYYGFFSCVFFIMLGLAGLGGGLSYPTGEIETYNLTTINSNQTGTITTEVQYTTMNPVWSRAFSFLFIFVGIYIGYASVEKDKQKVYS